jgi:uncharacterized peroxidase-related enzyme
MSWIEEVGPERAAGGLAQLYRSVASPAGQVDAVLRIHSLRPRSLKAHLELYKTALHAEPNGLSGRERELVGCLVSGLNGCGYCVAHHRVALAKRLRGAAEDAEAAAATLVEDALEGPARESGLSPRERALCAYARKLTRDPGAMRSADLEPLRESGLDDAAILDLNQVVAYFAYVNRVVQGLGVEIGGETLGLHPSDHAGAVRHE